MIDDPSLGGGIADKPDLAKIGMMAACPGGAGVLTALETVGDVIPGGGGPSSAIGGGMNNRSPIHIAPVGVNLGAIIAPFSQGGPENGGMGLDIASRFISGSTGARLTPMTSKPFPWTIVALGGLGVAGVYIFFKMRG